MDPVAQAPTSSRRKARLIALAVSLGILLVAALVVNSIASSRWKGFTTRIDAAIARARQATGVRTPLAGSATAGNAWDDYTPALAGIRKAGEGGAMAAGDYGKAVENPGDKEAAAKLRAFLPKIAADLDRMRAGTHRERALYPTEWEKGAAAAIPSLLDCRHAGNALVFSARERMAAGDRAGAIDDLTAVLQFGVDLAAAPGLIFAMIGVAELNLALAGFKDLVADAASTPAEVDRVKALMQAAEHGLPALSSILESDHLFMEVTLRDIGEGHMSLYDAIGQQQVIKGGLLDFGYTWRYYFSKRIMIVDAVQTMDTTLTGFRKGEAEDFKAAALRYEAIHKALESGNVIASLATTSLTSTDRTWRAAHARIRVILAAALARGGAAATAADWPLDPFDLKPLRRSEEGGTIRIRSVWHDCADGAAGGWSPKDNEDLVVELKKS